MIKKILTRNYLKGYGDMSDDERKAFDGRVGEWLAKHGTRLVTMTNRPMAKSQNLMTLTTRWTVEDCRAVEDGILLMSALVKVADTWLPSQIYIRSAYRSVRQMVEVMQTHPLPLPVMEGSGYSKNNGSLTITDEQRRRIVEKYTQKALKPLEQKTGAVISEPSGKPTGTRPTGTAAMVTTPLHYREGQGVGLVPARPRHIDQYVHLLPKATQERAEKYGPLMRELDEMREKQRLLLDADGVSARDREAVAKRIVAIDKEIGGIRRELDAEWYKLAKSGRVVVDDLGMARVKDIDHSPLTIDHSPFLDEPSGEAERTMNPEPLTIDHSPFLDEPSGEAERTMSPELSSEQKHRRRELRKFLTDTRRGNGKTREEHVGKWQEAWKEYLTLEPQEAAMKDEKILAAMEHYGIKV